MDFIQQLWLPIIVAAGFCFLASAIIWMIAPHHKKEWSTLPDEDGVMAALRGAKPGGYLFPHAFDNSMMKDPAFQAKVAAGPRGVLYLKPGGFNMGAMLGQQFVFFIVASGFVALTIHSGIDPGTPYLHVFHDAATAAFMAYFLAAVPESIWFNRPWKSLMLQGVDALIFALLTGGVFGWLGRS